MLSLRDISDQLEIQQNLWDYANAVDMHDYDLLDRVFLADARIHYGNQWFNREEAKQWLRTALDAPSVGPYFHLMASMRIEIDGDQATSHTRCFNPMELHDEAGQARLWLSGLWYHWRHVRTQEGWRISERLPDGQVFGWATPAFNIGDTGPPNRVD